MENSTTFLLQKTPTKKRPLEDHEDDAITSPFKQSSLMSSPKSPKFMKPTELFKKRRQQQLKAKQLPLKFSPTMKLKASLRRCKLPIESIEKLYSPLKCLQQSNSTNSSNNHLIKSPLSISISSPLKSPSSKSSNNILKPKRKITFSPLMKKLQRSPIQQQQSNFLNQLQFPIVNRNHHHYQNQHQNKFNRNPNLTRVLNFNEDTQDLPLSSKSTHQEPNNNNRIPNIDWTIKTRLRLVINQSIPFQGYWPALDESIGLNNFVRGTIDSTSATSSFSAELQRHCLVWQHPNLPGLKLFPRQPELKPGTTLSSRQPPIFQISPTGQLADLIYQEYCQSLLSIFKLLKSKYCPYFYLCFNNFLILFRSSGLIGNQEANALITPTTLGFRKLMQQEGIQFQMPFYETSTTKTTSTKTSKKKFSFNNFNDNSSTTTSSGIETDLEDDQDQDNDEDIEDEDAEDDDEESIKFLENDLLDQQEESNQWLESMGLSSQDFPSLETSSWRRKRQRIGGVGGGSSGPGSGHGHHGKGKSTLMMVDDQTARGRVKSLCRLNGLQQLQQLINLLLNNRKISISTSGQFAGIPPTILSPVAFHGATLLPLQVKQKTTTPTNPTTVTPGTSGTTMPSKRQPITATLTTLDIQGPILPNTVFGLMQLFGKFCWNHGSFGSSPSKTISGPIMIRSTLKTYDPSASFSLELGLQQQKPQQEESQRQQQENIPMNQQQQPQQEQSSQESELKFAVENLKDSGLDPKFLKTICSKNGHLSQPMNDFELNQFNGGSIRYNRFNWSSVIAASGNGTGTATRTGTGNGSNRSAATTSSSSSTSIISIFGSK